MVAAAGVDDEGGGEETVQNDDKVEAGEKPQVVKVLLEGKMVSFVP